MLPGLKYTIQLVRERKESVALASYLSGKCSFQVRRMHLKLTSSKCKDAYSNRTGHLWWNKTNNTDLCGSIALFDSNKIHSTCIKIESQR